MEREKKCRIPVCTNSVIKWSHKALVVAVLRWAPITDTLPRHLDSNDWHLERQGGVTDKKLLDCEELFARGGLTAFLPADINRVPIAHTVPYILHTKIHSSVLQKQSAVTQKFLCLRLNEKVTWNVQLCSFLKH